MDAVVAILEHLMSVYDNVPGLPNTPALAVDTVTGAKDPSMDDVKTSLAKDAADLAVPGLGTLGEAGAKNFGETMDNTRKKRDLLDDIAKSSERDPYQQDGEGDE